VKELQQDDHHLYFVSAEYNGVIRTVKSGGVASYLEDGQDQPSDLAMGPGGVYWINRGDGTVRRCTSSGTYPETLAQGIVNPESIEVDDDRIYVATGDGKILRIDPASGESFVLAFDQDSPTKLMVSGDWLYWLARGQTDKVMRVAK